MRQKHFYEFGPFRIDVALNRLERAGTPIPLPPKAFDLLVLLARNTDRVMSKTELMETLWPNTFVEEANLTQHVYTLRKALGDQPNGEPYIDTVPRRGYRLAADVREVTVDPNAAAIDVVPAPIDLINARQPRSPVVLEGERKHATVLQCRVANAATVIERLGSAAMHELTNELLTLAGEEVGRYEGVITERHTDGFAGVFGASVVHEDDARRATLASLAIRQRFRTLSPAGAADEEKLDLQIGVSTGSLVITRVASDRQIEYSAIGEAARVADLLQQLAEPGSLLISETTRRAVDGYVETAPAGIQAGSTTAFRVIRPFPTGAARHARFARTLARFVGRRHELALLDSLAARSRAGKGQVVSIVGEPGMGKSRLLHEFTQAVAAGAPMTLLEGRCVSYGSLIPYLPLAALIRSHCSVSDSDTPDTIRHAVERAVHDNGLPSDAGTWLLRLIGIVDSGTAIEALSPEAIKARTFDALRTLFFKASTRTPLVIMIEDIHWIDRTSEEFLTMLVERLVAARVMVLATYRPGYHVPWLDRSCLTQMRLTPLTAVDGAQLVDSVAGEQPLPELVSAAILEKAEGNPFFLEELARTVVERGPEAQGIPDTVQGVIMARVDRLPAVAKQVLQTASVLGREVPLPLLTRVWRGGDFAAEIAELCRLEFLYERPVGDQTVLVFKHALTQDVAYDSLLVRSRRELHLRAAEALADLYGDRRDDLAATFAYHYARTDLVDEAVLWLTRAADQAARVYANAEAILHLDLASRRLQRLPEGPERDRRMLEVALRHAHSLYFLGRFRDSVDVLLPHEARLARLNDLSLSAAYSFWLAHMYSRLGDQRGAAACAHRAIDAATAVGDEATLGKAHGLLALEGHWAGTPVEGIAHGVKALRLLEGRAEHQWWLGMAHFYVAMNHLLAGEFAAALAAAGSADAAGREIGDPRLQTYAGFTIAWVEASRGNCDAAIAVSRRSREQAPDRVSRAYASMLVGLALLEKREHEEARKVLEPIVAELEGFSFPQWHGLASTLLGEAWRAERRLNEAASFVDRGLRITTSAAYWYGVGFSHRIAGRIARDRGSDDEALTAFQQAFEVFERIGARFEAARTRLEIAETVGKNDIGRARAELAAALCAFQTLGTPVYADRARGVALASGLKIA